MALNMRPSGLVLEKKRILAWYDTTLVYIVLVAFGLSTAIFSLTGRKVALETPEYTKYTWVPDLLLVMSAVLILFCGVRLFYRLILKIRDRG